MLALHRMGVDIQYKFVYGSGTIWPISEPVSDDPRIEMFRRRPADPKLPQVVCSQPFMFYRNFGSYKIGFTMVEADGLPPPWVEACNKMDEIWVPSKFSNQTFAVAGVKAPIYVISLGVNPGQFNPGVRSSRFSDRFTFLSVFEWVERKGPDLLLRAFAEEFQASEPVLFLVYATNHLPKVDIRREVTELGIPKDHAPIVIIINKYLPRFQLGQLYRSVDCFVLPTRGEGFCLPLVEAMACAVPCIATDWSSIPDILDSGVGYPLRVARLSSASSLSLDFYTGFKWAEPDYEHLKMLLRYVYEHQDEAKDRAKRASDHVLRHFTWENGARRIVERLRAIS